MNNKFLAIALFAFLLLPSTALTTGQDEVSSGLAEWTFIIYLDADNNLENAGINDINEMEMVGSSDQVNIIAIMDRGAEEDLGSDDYAGEGDWTGLRIIHVQQDTNKDSFFDYVEGENMWFSEDNIEPNMGDPGTLSNYTNWVIDRFPAQKYMLDFWDHGGAWWGICWDDSEHPADTLRMNELSDGLANITAHLGRKLDIIGFDACLMADATVMYEIRDYCDIGVASGFNEPGDGWPYENIMPQLVTNPSMSPEDLSSIIVTAYIESYSDRENDPNDSFKISMSAFDMRKVENMIEAINELAMTLAHGPQSPSLITPESYYAQLAAIRGRTAGYDTISIGPIDIMGYCMYDLMDFADNLEIKGTTQPGWSFLVPAAQRVKTAVNEATIRSKLGNLAIQHQGVSIYFPSDTQTVYDDRHDVTKMAQEKYWDDFLRQYAIHGAFVANTPPSVSITGPVGSLVVPNDQSQLTITGTAFDLQDGFGFGMEIKINDGEWTPFDGGESWTYPLSLDELEGKNTICVRSTDGTDYSPEVTRSFTIEAAEEAPPKEETSGRSPWILVLVPVVIVGAIIAIKKGFLSR